MPIRYCPKCGKAQPSENTECIQCGVIFNKLTDRVYHPSSPPEKQIKKDDFLPPIGLKSNMEITILNVFTYIYLILGVGSGIGIILEGKDDFSFINGVMVISAVLVTSMICFIICTVAKKILSIDSILSYIAELLYRRA